MYQLTLRFRLRDADGDPVKYLDALFESGFDDALIGIGENGKVALMFDREGEALEVICATAVADVQKAIPGAVLESANVIFDEN